MTERFSKLPFPVHKIAAKSPEEMFAALPGLKRYFNTVPDGIRDLADLPPGRKAVPLDLVHIINYIVFLYDPETDLTYEYGDDIRLRKEAAAKEAGFHRNKNGDWPQYVEDIMNLKEPYMVDWVIDFLKVRKSAIWMEIKFLEEELDSLYRTRANNIRDGIIKGDLMKLTKERQDELSLLYKRFYADHHDLKSKTEDLLLPVSPENVFKELKIPKEVYQIKQAKDVPQLSGLH